ncbi:MAG: hypothetical protein A2138_20410 [Deltaproteobacteria bacterium RBG_16_71_12]|nr:MAG: hypothetical protein A2138_20410 [Deltaproteobacteria bacterium RBG_16_71_12]
MDKAECGFCGETRGSSDMLRGGKSSICATCFGAGLAWSIASRASLPRAELPEADRACSFCQKKTPASALFTQRDGIGMCASCMSRGFWFFANTGELDERRRTWSFLEHKSPLSLMLAHFDGVDVKNLVTSSRRFPEYLRVDLNRALQGLLPKEVHCVGLHQQYSHETLELSTMMDREGRVTIAPLQFDEVDIGDQAPSRCLSRAMWFAERDGMPHVVLLTPKLKYGESNGWRLEIGVPPGTQGDGIVQHYFKTIEAALAAASSYRGKVLSLEASQNARGTSGLVTVHRISGVARDDVILPRSTLELLERNVFRFAEQRPALKSMGLPMKKGLLFYGPPGTGKTHTIRYLAASLPGHTTLLITADQVANIEHYMTLARLLSPSMLVIEDADLIARQREDMNGPCEEVLLNRLLNEMDGLAENSEIFFVLTTNRPEAIEVALRARPGRIDQSIEFPLPDAEGRMKLARLYGRGAPISAETLDHIVERTAKVRMLA